MLIAACGDDDDATATATGSSSSTGPLAKAGFPDSCPATADTFDRANAATYQVFGEVPLQAADGVVPAGVSSVVSAGSGSAGRASA